MGIQSYHEEERRAIVLVLSTFYLQDGSFFRCTNISVGYTFSNVKNWSKGVISNLRVYVAADNLFTISKYKGYNPEVDYNDGAKFDSGGRLWKISIGESI